MEFGSIEREIHIEAAPEVVFDVVSSPEHLRGWWPDEAHFDATPGAVGSLVFGDPASPDAHVPAITVVDVDPPRLFSFRWVYPHDESARPDNSLLVRFELTPSGAGTSLRLVESGFREKGWEVAVLEEQYADHVNGWDHFLPRLVPYVATLAAR